ncbi:uncharacterized protein OCT59_030156 [Rhizophagus irregularis]|uniref:uncharacterized protein n=1 Tax=Rhizophagus irregularis TaxID=588596 RepID=UPI003330789A|nr:hypothetical protein OCT59_030156 [Rhizophagus irregularis]
MNGIKLKFVIGNSRIGEVKTTIDSHHAAIFHSIKRYIQIGYDIRDGEDIVEAAKHLSGTSLAHLKPN